jgi:hypothetical protein
MVAGRRGLVACHREVLACHMQGRVGGSTTALWHKRVPPCRYMKASSCQDLIAWRQTMALPRPEVGMWHMAKAFRCHKMVARCQATSLRRLKTFAR